MSQEPVNPRFTPGAVLNDKFVVERVLGQGGMGMVLAAHHRVLDRRVALKLLLPEALDSEGAVERFIREARSLAQLHSAHVARVLDVGALDDGLPFMVMELLEGEDLQATIEREGALQVEQAIDAMLQICDALAEAHGRGIVHRDLKPANLFLARTPEGSTSLKIIDFGIAKSTMREDFSLTTTRNMVGTPLYMSPEQVKAPKVVDTRSDIWALGVVLFELLTGRAPFVAETIGEIFAAILQAPIPDARRANPAIPEGLDAVLARCMERDLNRRFQTVQELSAALQRFASKERMRRIEAGESARSLVITRARPPDTKPAELPFAHTVERAAVVTQVSAGEQERRPRRGASVGVAVAAVACVVLVVAGGAWIRSRPSAAPPRVTSAPIVQDEGFAPLLPVAMPVMATAASGTPTSPSDAPPIPEPRPAASSRPSPPRAPSAKVVKPPPPVAAPKKGAVDVLEGRD